MLSRSSDTAHWPKRRNKGLKKSIKYKQIQEGRPIKQHYLYSVGSVVFQCE